MLVDFINYIYIILALIPKYPKLRFLLLIISNKEKSIYKRCPDFEKTAMMRANNNRNWWRHARSTSQSHPWTITHGRPWNKNCRRWWTRTTVEIPSSSSSNSDTSRKVTPISGCCGKLKHSISGHLPQILFSTAWLTIVSRFHARSASWMQSRILY